MKGNNVYRRGLTLLALAAMGSGCSNDNATGTLSLGVADAPVDIADQVVVEFSAVELQGGNGGKLLIDFGTDADGIPVNKSIDLLALQGGLRELLLDGEVLSTGQYSWIRLAVNAEADGVLDSYVVVNGAQYELRIPSGSESGLMLNTPFVVAENVETDFTVDFDLRQSLHNPEGQSGPLGPVYLLRPTLRLIDSNETGSVSGSIDPTLFTGLSCSAPEVGYAVYAYSGSGISPDDVDGIDPEPVNSAKATLSNGQYSYTLAFMEPGSYTVTATCQADGDDPVSDDALAFVGTASVSVSAGGDSTHDFAP